MAASSSAQTLTAVLTSPLTGAANVDISLPFQWTAVPDAQAYVLWVGTAAGAKDVVNTPEIHQTSFTATNLPGGALLYARMWTKVAGVWRFVDATFTTTPLAALTSPANAATNVSPLAPLQWTAVPNAQAYVVWVGSSPGTHDIVYTPQLHQAGYQPTAPLPGGQTLYARMWTEFGGAWRFVDSTFSTTPVTTLTSPSNGAINVSPLASIQWTAFTGAQAYVVWIGTSPGAHDVVNSPQTQLTAYQPSNPLPGGTLLYVRMWTEVGGVWRSVDTSFTTVSLATLTTPSDGATNVSPLASVQWSAAAGAQAYVLWIGTSPGASNIVNSPQTLLTSYQPPSALPGGQLLYVRMWTEAGGVWRSVDSTFTVAPAAIVTSPRSGSTVIDPRPVFSWSPVAGAQAYYLYVGTAPGTNNVVNTREIQTTSYQPAAPLTAAGVLYMRLWTKWGGVWRSVDTQFTLQPAAFLLTPPDGTTNVEPGVQFTWSAVTGAQAYYLYVGTTPGAHDVVNTGEVQTTSYAGAPLPLGKVLFARMWTKTGGTWRFLDSQFTTVTVAELIWPATGPANIDPNATFTWTTAPAGQSYRLEVGTTKGSHDVFDTAETTGTSYSAANLPGGVPLFARMSTKVNGAWFYSDTPFTAAAILDDFSTAQIRQTTSGQDLWSHYDEGAPGDVLLRGDGTLEETVLLGNGTANGGGAYLQFVPKTDNSYAFPSGYTRRYMEKGTWNPEFNRLTFRMKVNRSVVGTTDHIFEVGTYIRPHFDGDVGNQGFHFYHFLSPNVYQDQWIYVTLNRVPQHQVGQDSNWNWGENPTGDPYFDDLTRFYIDDIYQSLDGATVVYDDFRFERVENEPDALVSNTTAGYSGTRYEMSWNTPKWVNQTYEISYSTSSLKKNGFESGTYGGWIVSQGSAYTWVRWVSPEMSQAAGGLFIAIRPVGQTAFTELYVPSN